MENSKSKALNNKKEEAMGRETEEKGNGEHKVMDKSVHHKKHAMDCKGC